MFTKIKAFWQLFQAGKEVADPAKWKRHTITANTLVVFLAALAAVAPTFGVQIPVTDAELQGLAVGILAAVNIVMHYVTDSKVGYVPKQPKDAGTTDTAPPGAAPSAGSRPTDSDPGMRPLSEPQDVGTGKTDDGPFPTDNSKD